METLLWPPSETCSTEPPSILAQRLDWRACRDGLGNITLLLVLGPGWESERWCGKYGGRVQHHCSSFHARPSWYFRSIKALIGALQAPRSNCNVIQVNIMFAQTYISFTDDQTGNVMLAPVADILNYRTGACNSHLFYEDEFLEVLLPTFPFSTS